MHIYVLFIVSCRRIGTRFRNFVPEPPGTHPKKVSFRSNSYSPIFVVITDLWTLHSMENQKAIDRMKAYKGPPLPEPWIPMVGVILGAGVPFLLRRFIFHTLTPTTEEEFKDHFQLFLKHQIGISFLFLSEFIFGAIARSTSAKASFSPAAAAASPQTQPFLVVQSNRIHQNHLESWAIFGTASLAATAAASGKSLDWILASHWTWILSRFLYRLGYMSPKNPFLRLIGTTSSLIQTGICWGIVFYGAE